MQKILLYALAVAAILFWSSSFVWTKVAYDYYNPLTVVFLRLALAGFILELSIRLMRKKNKMERGDFKKFLLLTLYEPFFYFLGESFGIKFLPATLGAIMISTIPLFTPLYGSLFLKEKFERRLTFSLFISFLGVSILVGRDFSGSASLGGILLMLFAVFSGISYGWLVKKLAHKYSSIFIVKTQSQLGALYFLPLFLIFDFKKFIRVVPDVTVIVTLLKLAVFASCLAYIFFTVVIRHLGIPKANAFTNLIPVFTAIISYFVLHEHFAFFKGFGILLVVSGLFLAQRTKSVPEPVLPMS